MMNLKSAVRPATKARKPDAVVPPGLGVPVPGSLGEWLEYIMPDATDGEWVPMWPPDAFAIGAALLRRTGGYLDLVNGDELRGQIPVLPAAANTSLSSRRRRVRRRRRSANGFAKCARPRSAPRGTNCAATAPLCSPMSAANRN